MRRAAGQRRGLAGGEADRLTRHDEVDGAGDHRRDLVLGVLVLLPGRAGAVAVQRRRQLRRVDRGAEDARSDLGELAVVPVDLLWLAHGRDYRIQLTVLHPTQQAVGSSIRLCAGAALARVLGACGVREVFGVPAGKLAAFLQAVGEEDRLTHVGVRHEAAASWMAAAVYAATGRIAVAYGESGPGSHNLVSGLGS